MYAQLLAQSSVDQLGSLAANSGSIAGGNSIYSNYGNTNSNMNSNNNTGGASSSRLVAMLNANSEVSYANGDSFMRYGNASGPGNVAGNNMNASNFPGNSASGSVPTSFYPNNYPVLQPNLMYNNGAFGMSNLLQSK